MEDFMNSATPTSYGLTYGYNGTEAPGAELAFGMLGAYVQDEWSLSDVFRLTYGLRMDLPVPLNRLPSNPAISNLTFADGRKIDVSVWPTAQWQYSPRLGFRWDVKNDRSIILTGGTGLFTGMLPFVWYTNQPTNSGVLQNALDPLTNIPAGFPFYPDYRDAITAHPDIFPGRPAERAPGAICFVDPGFKMPQVWRNSVGADIQLPLNFMLSLNALYTRDIYNVTQINVNEKAPVDRFNGNDNRYYYPARDNRVNTGVSSAMMLTNGDEKGYQYSLNAVLTKKFENGFYGMLSYTYSQSRDMTANPGSTASSAWSSNVAVNSLNAPGLSYSSFAVPHRLIANVSYEIEYLKHLKTTFALFYTGYHTGRISYTAANTPDRNNYDLNGDGNSSDLLYIPASKDELIFTDYTSNGQTYTKEEQAADFWNFIEGNSYLTSRKGKYAERYGDLKPWLNRFDFKVTQDFFINLGGKRYALQASLDVLNAGNMLNSAWGIYTQNGLASYDNLRPLRYIGMTDDKRPVYQIAANNHDDFLQKSTWTGSLTTDSTWGMLLGLKAIF
jgi:hypothetical protein